MKSAAKKVRVLLVDDSAAVRERFASLLEDVPGIEIVGTATDGISTRLKLRELNPDLLVLDLELPGESGFHILKAIRDERPFLAIMVLTSYAELQFRRLCFTLGADYFFSKTTEFQHALAACADLAQRHQKGVRLRPTGTDGL